MGLQATNATYDLLRKATYVGAGQVDGLSIDDGQVFVEFDQITLVTEDDGVAFFQLWKNGTKLFKSNSALLHVGDTLSLIGIEGRVTADLN